MPDALVSEKPATTLTSSSQGVFGTHLGITEVNQVVPTDATKELLRRISGKKSQDIEERPTEVIKENGGVVESASKDVPVFAANKDAAIDNESESSITTINTNSSPVTLKPIAIDGIVSPTEKSQRVQIEGLNNRITGLTEQVQELILQLARKNKEIGQVEVMAQIKVAGQIEQLRTLVKNYEEEIELLKKDGVAKDEKIIVLEEANQNLKIALREADTFNVNNNPLFGQSPAKIDTVLTPEILVNEKSETLTTGFINLFADTVRKLEHIRSHNLREAQRNINRSFELLAPQLEKQETSGAVAHGKFVEQTTSTRDDIPTETLTAEDGKTADIVKDKVITEESISDETSVVQTANTITPLTSEAPTHTLLPSVAKIQESDKTQNNSLISESTAPDLSLNAPTETTTLDSPITTTNKIEAVSPTEVTLTGNSSPSISASNISESPLPEGDKNTIVQKTTITQHDEKVVTPFDTPSIETPVTTQAVTLTETTPDTIHTMNTVSTVEITKVPAHEEKEQDNPTISIEVLKSLYLESVSLPQMFLSPFGLLDKTVKSLDLSALSPELKDAFENGLPDTLLSTELFAKYKNTKTSEVYLGNGAFTGTNVERTALSAFIKMTLAFYLPEHIIPTQESDLVHIFASSTLGSFWTVTCELYAERKAVANTAEDPSSFMVKVFDALNLHNADNNVQQETLEDARDLIYLNFMSKLLYGKINDTITINPVIEALRKAFAMDEKEAVANKDHVYAFFMIALENFLLNEQYRSEILALFAQAKEEELEKLTTVSV